MACLCCLCFPWFGGWKVFADLLALLPLICLWAAEGEQQICSKWRHINCTYSASLFFLVGHIDQHGLVDDNTRVRAFLSSLIGYWLWVPLQQLQLKQAKSYNIIIALFRTSFVCLFLVFCTPGLIRCLVVHSGHTWLSTGTSHGHLVNWDLRYQREIAFAALPYQNQVSILNLKVYESPRQQRAAPPATLVCQNHCQIWFLLEHFAFIAYHHF